MVFQLVSSFSLYQIWLMATKVWDSLSYFQANKLVFHGCWEKHQSEVKSFIIQDTAKRKLKREHQKKKSTKGQLLPHKKNER